MSELALNQTSSKKTSTATKMATSVVAPASKRIANLAAQVAPALKRGRFEDAGSENQSPAYKVLQKSGLLCWDYNIASAVSIDGVPANSSMWRNSLIRGGLFAAGVVPYYLDRQATTHFVVKEGHIRCGQDKGGRYYFFLAGVHRLFDPFMQVDNADIPITQECIVHGNRSIVTISEGFVGLCYDRGQPILLPPGLHQWKSDTLVFQRSIDLAKSVVDLGPYTLVTVDEGYAAITQDNGKQVILNGGEMHMLTHRNWKFEKFLTQKIQTDDLKSMLATTADNVVLNVTANISWIIRDVGLAARMASDTMATGGDDLQQIRNDVFKQCSASLSAFVGGLKYAESSGVSASTATAAGQSAVFDAGRLGSAVAHANENSKRYGVEVIGINILSAVPQDQRLSEALAAGAVAQANAEQAEATAQGQMKALMITTKGQTDAIRAKAEADLDAARKLEQSSIAVELARIRTAGEAISDKHSLFFGASGPGTLPALFANPEVVSRSKL